MSTSPNITVDISQIDAISATTSLSPHTTITSSGEVVPGTMHAIGATMDDRILFYVDATGASIGQYPAMATIPSGAVAVNQFAGTGDLVLMYVKNSSGSTIDQGWLCQYDISELDASVEVAGAAASPGSIVGVTLCDLPTASAGWIAVRGDVMAMGGGVVAAGAGIIPDGGGASGEFVIVTAAATDAVLGVAVVLAANATLSQIRLK